MHVFDHDRLRTARLDLAMTQADAAEALGIATRTYRRYESGAVNHPQRGFRVRHADRQNIVLTMCAVFEVAESELVVQSTAPAPASGSAGDGFVVSVTTCTVDPSVLGQILSTLRRIAPGARLDIVPLAA